jgi:hypothetical protein
MSVKDAAKAVMKLLKISFNKNSATEGEKTNSEFSMQVDLNTKALMYVSVGIGLLFGIVQQAPGAIELGLKIIAKVFGV